MVARDVGLPSVMTRRCAPPPRIRRRVVAPAIDGPRRAGQGHSERSHSHHAGIGVAPWRSAMATAQTNADDAAAPLDQLLVDAAAGPLRRWLPGRPGVELI